MSDERHTDVLVIGSGIAAVMDPADSFELHVQDTLRAGAGLCAEAAVRRLVREGPERVRELMEWGARFTMEQGRLSLGREGGHSRRRIVHAEDLTGWEIDRVLKERGDRFVLLDLSPIGPDVVARRFPCIVAGCAERGVDALREPIPVVPAAHYACGGVLTDEDGRTGLHGLYAAGEVACTGVHEANRLASNSLLEAVVYSHRASLAVRDDPTEEPTDGSVPAPPCGGVPDRSPSPAGGEPPDIGTELRDVLWNDCVIVRNDGALEHARTRVAALHARAEALWHRGPVTADAAETRNLCQVGALIVASARMRRESRGLHYNVDHPFIDERFRADTVVVPGCLGD